MKKFFSLVLALVMALSLTTVAWGATTHSVSTAAELIELLDNDSTGDVQNGDVIMLTGNVTFDTTNRSFNSGSYYDGVLYTGGASFTIDLGGYTITSDAGALNDYLLNIANKTTATANTITIKNGTLTAVSGVYSALCVGSSAATAPTTVNTENLTINGVHPDGAVVKIRGGSTWNANAGTIVNSNGAYTALECSAATANINAGAKLNQTNSSADPSVGSAIGVSGGGVVNVNGAEIGSDRYGAFVYPTGGTLNVISGTVTAPTALYCDEYTAGYYIADSVINVSGGTITGDVGFRGIDGGDPAISISGGTVDGDILANTGDDLTVSGGTFTADVSDYVPAGYAQFNASGNTFTVNPATPGSSSTGDFDLHMANALGTVVKEDCSYKKVAATYNEATGTGDLEYYVINGTDAYVVISVADATTSDFYLTEANKTAPLFYLRKIDSVADVHYDFIAKEFTDFGVKCGQMNAAYADYYTNEVSFYVWTDPVTGAKVYFADDAVTTGAPFYNGAVLRSGASNLLVGKEIVKAYGFVVSGTDNPADPLNQHVWSPVAYDKTVPTQALCGICGAKANLYKDGKVPAMSVVDARFDINGTFYNAVVTSTGYTGSVVIPVKPSTDKVTSADTFDAGIAMYVGMSVMAAAGSVVVLKKRED